MHRKSQKPMHRGRLWHRGVPKQSIQQWRGQRDLALPNAVQFDIANCCLFRHRSLKALANQRQCTRVPEKCVPCRPPQDSFDVVTIACFSRLLEESLSEPNELHCAITALSGEEYLQAGPTQPLSVRNQLNCLQSGSPLFVSCLRLLH